MLWHQKGQSWTPGHRHVTDDATGPSVELGALEASNGSGLGRPSHGRALQGRIPAKRRGNLYSYLRLSSEAFLMPDA